MEKLQAMIDDKVFQDFKKNMIVQIVSRLLEMTILKIDIQIFLRGC